jgi:hypothetical protein
MSLCVQTKKFFSFAFASISEVDMALVNEKFSENAMPPMISVTKDMFASFASAHSDVVECQDYLESVQEGEVTTETLQGMFVLYLGNKLRDLSRAKDEEEGEEGGEEGEEGEKGEKESQPPSVIVDYLLWHQNWIGQVDIVLKLVEDGFLDAIIGLRKPGLGQEDGEAGGETVAPQSVPGGKAKGKPVAAAPQAAKGKKAASSAPAPTTTEETASSIVEIPWSSLVQLQEQKRTSVELNALRHLVLEEMEYDIKPTYDIMAFVDGLRSRLDDISVSKDIFFKWIGKCRFVSVPYGSELVEKQLMETYDKAMSINASVNRTGIATVMAGMLETVERSEEKMKEFSSLWDDENGRTIDNSEDPTANGSECGEVEDDDPTQGGKDQQKEDDLLEEFLSVSMRQVPFSPARRSLGSTSNIPSGSARSRADDVGSMAPKVYAQTKF